MIADQCKVHQTNKRIKTLHGILDMHGFFFELSLFNIDLIREYASVCILVSMQAYAYILILTFSHISYENAIYVNFLNFISQINAYMCEPSSLLFLCHTEAFWILTLNRSASN